MGKEYIIDIENDKMLKIKLTNLYNTENYNKFFSYTKKIEPLDIKNIISNKFYEKEHQFFFENNKSNLSFIGFGSVDIIEIANSNQLKLAANQIDEKLNSIINISENDEVSIKYFGGYKFDIDSKNNKIWNKFPRGYFVLPECMITFDEYNTWITIIKKIQKESSPESDCQAINNIYNHIKNSNSIKLTTINESIRDTNKNNIDKEYYLDTVNKIINDIKLNDINKLVYSREKHIQLKQTMNLTSAIKKLREIYPECINYFIKIPGRGTFLGSTPERLINNNNGEIITEAVAGTIHRGYNADNDMILEKELKNNKKYVEEHEIVVEEIKRLLNPKLIDIKASKEPYIFKLHNLQHLITEITGTLKNNTHILDLVKVLHPTPAVAGIPTENALKLIAKYELHDRGWYSGPLGWIDKIGNGDFCVALRSAYLIEDTMTIFAGGGIVEKSIPEDEWEETEIKFKTILSIFGDLNYG